ncbi:hypothetical protein [Phaeobacter sp. 11ANDIMAR09]|uniref:hypothetical protein n=1 Tax=Phaeobacter sp. 11ANDIMAR09 TaxID=1225647 RepID=UPI0006C8839E|nr:hypothetical protein [Phaeobacter sp. 11ANDIMAR09]KPD10378.1 hypothetical protein AN476_21330 [Phaeobacter sp. 11ANDIMAR09]
MARKRKTRPTPKVTLPPFTWDTRAKLPDGTEARLARPSIEQAEVETGASQGADGQVVLNRARVWRVKTPSTLRILNPASRAAVLDYAEVFETVHSSGGTSDPTSGTGGPAARGPNLRALTAATRLRQMHAALADGELVVPLKDARSLRRSDGLARVSFRQLVQWVAVDELSRAEILRKAGAAASNETAQDAVTLAIVELAQCLVLCCGYNQTATPCTNSRNSPNL